MAVFRNHRQPLSVSDINDFVTLGVLFAVITDRGIARNDVVFVDDCIADTAVFANIDIVQQNAVVNGRIAVNINRIEKHGVGDSASRNDAAVANNGVDRFADARKSERVNILVMNELRRRKTEMVVVNRPFVIVEIKLRLRRPEIHVGFKERLESPDVAPVRFLADRLTGDLVGIEIVGIQPPGTDKPRNNVFSEIMRTGFLLVIVFEKRQHIVGIENIIAHGSKRHILVVRQRSRFFRLLLKTDDPPVLVHLNDTELAGLTDRDRDRRNGGNGVVAAVEIDHLADIHLIDMVAAEHCDKIRFEILNQPHVLINGIGSSPIPGAVLRLHLRGHGNNETAAHLCGRNIPAVDDMLHQALRLELRQHENTVDSAVDKITQHKVDDTVFSSERNGWFCTLIGKRGESGTLPSGKNHSQDRCSHSRSPLIWSQYIQYREN